MATAKCHDLIMISMIHDLIMISMIKIIVVIVIVIIVFFSIVIIIIIFSKIKTIMTVTSHAVTSGLLRPASAAVSPRTWHAFLGSNTNHTNTLACRTHGRNISARNIMAFVETLLFPGHSPAISMKQNSTLPPPV